MRDTDIEQSAEWGAVRIAISDDRVAFAQKDDWMGYDHRLSEALRALVAEVRSRTLAEQPCYWMDMMGKGDCVAQGGPLCTPCAERARRAEAKR